MLDPIVGVIHARDKHKSAKCLADLQPGAPVLCDEQLPLSEALERSWEQDSHLLLYRVDGDDQGDEYAFARVSKRSPFISQLQLAGGRIRVPLLVFDHDLPKSPDGTKQRWTDASLEAFLAEEHGLPPPTWFYTTLHGSRWIYVLTEEVSQAEAEQILGGMIAASEGFWDPARSDWTGCYRLPKTVREDTGATFAEDSCFLLVSGGPEYDPADMPHVQAGPTESFAIVNTDHGPRPEHDEIQGMLRDEQGDTELVRVARLRLQGREGFAICFEHKPLCDGEEAWNNQVTKVVGQVVGMLAQHDPVTPQGVYAIMHSAIEQLQDRENRGMQQTDWFNTTWDIITRLWNCEESQLRAAQAEHGAKLEVAKEKRAELVEQLRAERPQDVPTEPKEAQEWFARRMIASNGRQHYVMRPDGSYNFQPVRDSMLTPMIRELGMDELIPTTEIRGKTIAMRAAAHILNDHATPVLEIECSPREEFAYIDGEAGYKTLHIPIHQLNPKLLPGGKFDARVDEWLRKLGGEQYERLAEWLAHSLDVRRPICALNLFGSPGTGKGMLAAGLAECFRGECLNDGRALGKWNLGLLKSPIVVCDEGVPQIASDEALPLDQAFRSMVSGGKMTMRGMRMDPFTATVHPRILFTSNDRDIIRSIVGARDLTADDIQAIELRLLSIEVSDEAQCLLTARGNYAYTAGWVAGAGESKYILANHIFYLFTHRKPSQLGSGRLLVEGECSTTLVREMRLRSRAAQTVLRSLIKMIESPQQSRPGFHIHNNRVWVTAAGLVEFAEKAMEGAYGELSLPVAGRVLRQFSVQSIHSDNKLLLTQPPGTEREQRGRWIEVDLGLLMEEGLRYGITLSRVEGLLRDQAYGEERIAAILIAAQQAAEDK